MSSSKKSSRWSRFAGSSTSSEDFYSTDSDPIALTRENEPEGQIAGLDSEKENEKASMATSPAVSSQPSSPPLVGSEPKPNRGLVGRLRKMTNTNKSQSTSGKKESESIEDSTSTGRLNKYSVRREDTPLSSSLEDQAESSSTSEAVNFPQESTSSSPTDPTPISSTHQRTQSRASLSSLSSKLLFGHFASSIASSSDHGSIRSSNGSDEGTSEALPNLGSIDFDIASDFGVVNSSSTSSIENGKGKGKAVFKGQLPPSVALALKDAGKEKTPRLVYGAGGASASTSSVLKGNQADLEPVEAISSTIETGKVESSTDLTRKSSIPSPIDDTKSIASSEGGNHSRIRSLEPSLIGFSLEDDESENSKESEGDLLETKSPTRRRRDSIDSTGTIKDEGKEDGDESMPGSFFFSPPARTSSEPQTSESVLNASSSRSESESPNWDGGDEYSPVDQQETMEDVAAGSDASAYAAAIAGDPKGIQDTQDQFLSNHSAAPSEAYHSLEPSLDDSASTLTTSANFNTRDFHAADPSNVSSSESKSFRTLSAEDLRAGLTTTDTSRPARAPYMSRRTTIKKPIVLSEGQGVIPVSQRWLSGEKALGESSQEKKHYLIKEMVREELSWELDRAWLLNVDEKVEKPEVSEEDDFLVFQPSNEEIPSLSLPLLEFLFEHVFASFPLFKASEWDFNNESSFSPKEFLKESILPLLSARQQRSLSSRVDRLGEGDGTPFSARSTLDGIKSILLKWMVNYVTSVLRVNSNQTASSSTLQDGKRSLPWPSPNLLPPEAYLACRKPNLNSLRHGGMEITFDSMRVRRGENGFYSVDYLLCIKRPNRKSRLVVRNEADFEQFAVSISKELGADSRVRPLPARGDYSESDEEDFEEADPNSSKSSTLTSVLANRFTLGKSSTTVNTLPHNKSSTNLGRKSSFGKSTTSLARRRSRSNSGSTPAPPLQNKSSKQFGSDATGRSSRLRKFSVKSQDTKPRFGLGEDSSDSDNWDKFWSQNQVSSRRGLPVSSAPSTPGLDENKRIDFDLPRPEEGASKSQRSSMEAPKFTGLNFGSLNFGNKSKTSLKSKTSGNFGKSTSSLVPQGQNGENKDNGGGSGRSSQDSRRARQASQSNPNLPDLPNKRRRRLRAWLRDTTSIRGAIDSREARDFLSIGSFGEQDLKPSDVSAMSAVKQYDERRRAQREEDEKIAGEEILGLRESIDRIWEDCKVGDGFPKILWAIQRSPTFSSLPVPYQQILSYTNLQIARFLHGTFVASNVSRGNLARARDLFSSVPWSILGLAFKEPTGKMLEMVQDSILKPASIQNILAILLEDNDPTSLDEQLYELKNLIHSGMMTKIERFVESDDQLKRIVRDHAERSGIPLVAAIVRSSEEPRLSDSEMQQVISASNKYQEFMSSQPSIVRQRANKTQEYLLISRLQRALRLLSLQRDGSQIRSAMQDPSIAACLANLFSPFNEVLTDLHGVEGISSSVSHLQRFLKKVLDLLSALRARVLDPAQALNEIATLLDQGTVGWYEFLHKASLSPSSKGGIESLFDWATDLATLAGSGSPDLAQLWSRTPEVPLEKIANASESLLAFAKRKRNRQMELACRWVAGSTDGDLSIQVHGDGLGHGRIHPFFPREPTPLSRKNIESLGSLRPDFAKACDIALGRLVEKQ